MLMCLGGIVAQWLRGRFNDSYEKTEWAKMRCSEELPFVDRLIHDKARETVSTVLVSWTRLSKDIC
jgi:hypothetical protein